jgi:hypothetical protein
VLIHSLKCIFIHVPKVAGQSIEAAMRSVLPEAERDKRKLLLRKADRREPGPLRLAHMTAMEYVQLGHVSSAQFRSYFKFAFVRNPWHRAYSLYRHFGFESYVGFEYFLENILKKEMQERYSWFVRPQCDFLLDSDGNRCVDFVGRFENLEEDFQQVASTLNLDVPDLPYVNRGGSGIGISHLRALRRYPRVIRHWRGFRLGPAGTEMEFSKKSSRIIEKLYGSDIAEFGYSAPPPE